MSTQTSATTTSLPRHVPVTLCLQLLLDDAATQFGCVIFGLMTLVCIKISYDTFILHIEKFEKPELILLVFIAGGAVAILQKAISGARFIHLLRHGIPVMATLASIKRHSDWNSILTFNLVFEFTTGSGQQGAIKLQSWQMKSAWLGMYLRECGDDITSVSSFGTCHLHGGWTVDLRLDKGTTDAAALTQTDQLSAPGEVKELVYYLPGNPSVNIIPVMTNISPEIGLDEQGNVHGGNPKLGVRAGIIPAIFLMGVCWEIIDLTVKYW